MRGGRRVRDGCDLPTATYSRPPSRDAALDRGESPPGLVAQVLPARTEHTARSPLRSGMYYQLRVMALDGAGNPLAQTEDLKGVFFMP